MTVEVFNAIDNLDAAATSQTSVSLSWLAASPIHVPTNLDAEDGNVGGGANGPPVGWTVTAGQTRVQTATGTYYPREGVYCFDGGNVDGSRAYQRLSPLSLGLTIAQVDAGDKDITLTYWVGTWIQSPTDQARINIRFYDEDNVLISTYTPAYKNPTTAPPGTANVRWNEYQDTTTIPVGTRFFEIELDTDRRAGTANNGMIDDIRITLESAAALPYVPGYAIIRDGALIDTAPANATSYEDTTVVGETTYEYKVVPYDGTTYLALDSNIASVTTPGDAVVEVQNEIRFFSGEEVFFRGYLGGRLKGTTVACPGNNVNGAKPCC